MNRRDLLSLFGGAAAWPVAARAQMPKQMRRIGVLMNLGTDDWKARPASQRFYREYRRRVGPSAATHGSIYVGVRAIQRNPEYVREVVALAPDVILASTNEVMVPLRQATRNIPIVFAAVTDPVAAGLVESLARPGGNATGFTSADYGMSAKWLELLKDVAPNVARVAVLYDVGNPGGLPQFSAVQAIAPSLRVELTSIALSDTGEIERAVAAFAGSSNGGLVVTRLAEAIVHRELIIKLAARHRLPAVYPLRLFVTDGGLFPTTRHYRRAPAGGSLR